MSKIVSLVPITSNELDRVAFYPNGDGTWKAFVEYHINDDQGNHWKISNTTFQVANANVTLAVLVASGINSINASEGLV